MGKYYNFAKVITQMKLACFFPETWCIYTHIIWKYRQYHVLSIVNSTVNF